MEQNIVKNRHHKLPIIIISIVAAIIVAVGIFFGVQFFTKTGLFRIPGVVYYDESLTTAEIDFLKSIFTDELDLDKDVTISATTALTMPELQEGQFLYEIFVPTTDFYSTVTSISSEQAYALLSSSTPIDNVNFVKISDLDASSRLLSIDNNYYLDQFTAGAAFRIISFNSEKYADEIAPLVTPALAKSFPAKDTVLTFAQTGVTALSRGMNAKLNAVGDATYFAANIKDFLGNFDLTHTSNESSFSPYASSANICSDSRFIDTLTAIGLDIVELTGNHNQDCGDESALNTIDTYNNLGIKIVGGGKTAEEAAKPLEISEKGTNITFLAYNQSTGGATYDGTPGANQYYEETAARDIKAAKDAGNIVIVDVQYYECAAYASEYEDPICDYADSAAGDQIGFFRHLIDLGADVVVGTSAHQPQTFERYNGGAIYYGLGNLFFDQIWWPGTTRSLVLGHYFWDGKLLQTKITPTVYDKNMQPAVMDPDRAAWFINRLLEARPAPANIGLQATVNDWRTKAGGNTSVIVYDLDHNNLLASTNPNEFYNIASLYKLFVVYEGYLELLNGTRDGNSPLAGHTYSECLDLAIRESNSDCAEALWSLIGRTNMQNTINSWGFTHTNLGNISNATDITKIMQKILFPLRPHSRNLG